MKCTVRSPGMPVVTMDWICSTNILVGRFQGNKQFWRPGGPWEDRWNLVGNKWIAEMWTVWAFCLLDSSRQRTPRQVWCACVVWLVASIGGRSSHSLMVPEQPCACYAFHFAYSQQVSYFIFSSLSSEFLNRNFIPVSGRAPRSIPQIVAGRFS